MATTASARLTLAGALTGNSSALLLPYPWRTRQSGPQRPRGPASNVNRLLTKKLHWMLLLTRPPISDRYDGRLTSAPSVAGRTGIRRIHRPDVNKSTDVVKSLPALMHFRQDQRWQPPLSEETLPVTPCPRCPRHRHLDYSPRPQATRSRLYRLTISRPRRYKWRPSSAIANRIESTDRLLGHCLAVEPRRHHIFPAACLRCKRQFWRRGFWGNFETGHSDSFRSHSLPYAVPSFATSNAHTTFLPRVVPRTSKGSRVDCRRPRPSTFTCRRGKERS